MTVEDLIEILVDLEAKGKGDYDVVVNDIDLSEHHISVSDRFKEVSI